MSGIPERKGPFREGRYHKMIMASQDSTDADHNWLITLSDVMSLLLVFFIIFFAMSRVQGIKKEAPRSKGAVPPISTPVAVPNPNNTLETIQKDIRAAVTELSLDDQVKIQVINQEIVITMKENVTFRTGDSDILSGSEPILDTIAEMVVRYPAFQVEIDGHTDDQPINTRRFPSNWELSVARATSVLKYLITKHGLDPALFTIKGNGEQRPLSDNSSSEQRAQNRRVEIRMKELPRSIS
jgi:chemotaxis protein MotB